MPIPFGATPHPEPCTAATAMTPQPAKPNQQDPRATRGTRQHHEGHSRLPDKEAGKSPQRPSWKHQDHAAPKGPSRHRKPGYTGMTEIIPRETKMPTTKGTPDQKAWYRTEFAFASADRCCCYKHKTSSGKNKRCPHNQSSIGLTDPENPDAAMRTFCLDCWITCRTERTQPNPAQVAMYQQMRREGPSLIAMGC